MNLQPFSYGDCMAYMLNLGSGKRIWRIRIRADRGIFLNSRVLAIKTHFQFFVHCTPGTRAVKNATLTVGGLSWVTGTLFLERRVAVEFSRCFCFSVLWGAHVKFHSPSTPLYWRGSRSMQGRYHKTLVHKRKKRRETYHSFQDNIRFTVFWRVDNTRTVNEEDAPHQSDVLPHLKT